MLKENVGFCSQYLREMLPKQLLGGRKPKDQKETDET